MPADLHLNFAYSTVATAPSPATSGTSLVVGAGEGVRFPTVPFNLTIWPAGQQPLAANAEIVRVTKRVTDTLTIVRAQEGTSARSVVVGDQVAATISKKTLEDVEKPLSLPGKVSQLTIISHSYGAGSTQTDSGVPNVYQESCVAKLMALLGVTDENTMHLGQAASALISPTNLITPSMLSGWAGVLQFVVPNNSKAVNAAADVVVTDPVIGSGGVYAIIHGVNDFVIGLDGTVADNDKRALQANNAYAHALRTTLSRIRAGAQFGSTMVNTVVTWDPIFTAFGGTWNSADTSNQTPINSGVAYRDTNDYATPASFTITIPANFTGGVVAVCLISQVNGASHITANMTSGQTTLPVADNSKFPTSGTLVVKIGTEEMLVTSGLGTATWTVTRGVNGTSAAAHNQNDVVFIADDTHKIDWSGTAAGASGSTMLGGQGAGNKRVPVVKRFVLTGADAGKTIIGTAANPVSGDTSARVAMDSCWIEAPPESAPPTVMTNLLHWPTNSYPVTLDLSGYISAFNTMMANTVAEFDQYVQIADVYTEWWKRNGLLGTTLAAVGGITTGVTFTANDASFTPKVGQLFAFGWHKQEQVIVTAVSGTAPNWTLSIQRAVNGSPLQTHAINDFMGPFDWLHSDHVHLNLAGHSVFAEKLYQALEAMPFPGSYQMAQGQGVWSQSSQQISMGIIDQAYLYTPCTAVTIAVGPAFNTQWAVPIFIPKTCIATGIGIAITSGGTGSTLRLGLYLPDASHSRPGRLLQEFGSVASTSATDSFIIAGYQLLRPGWYWLSGVHQSGSVRPTTRNYTSFGLPFPEIMTPNALTSTKVLGVSQTGITGALADWGLSYTYETGTNTIVRMFLRLRSPMFA